MTEFELKGQTYRAGKLDAFKQFHVSRKIAPIIPTLIPLFTQIATAAAEDESENLVRKLTGAFMADPGQFAAGMQPFMDGLAALPNHEVEYVRGTCLGIVQRKQGNAWAAVWNEQHNACMFGDVGLDVMLLLVVRVVRENLGNFISGLLTNQLNGAAASA